MKRIAAILLFVSAPAWTCDGLQVTNAWIREAPPGTEVMAAYAELHNAGKDSVTLDGARSSDFGEIQMHRTSMEDGRMRMRAEPQILLEPDATVSFEPGGLHLMLFGPKRALKAGDRATLKLDCGKRSKAVDFVVRSEE